MDHEITSPHTHTLSSVICFHVQQNLQRAEIYRTYLIFMNKVEILTSVCIIKFSTEIKPLLVLIPDTSTIFCMCVYLSYRIGLTTSGPGGQLLAWIVGWCVGKGKTGERTVGDE